MSELHALQLTDLEGNECSLSDYAGKILLLVNVASRCGLNPQYKYLEEIHQCNQERGLSVMGLPFRVPTTEISKLPFITAFFCLDCSKTNLS